MSIENLKYWIEEKNSYQAEPLDAVYCDVIAKYKPIIERLSNELPG